MIKKYLLKGQRIIVITILSILFTDSVCTQIGNYPLDGDYRRFSLQATCQGRIMEPIWTYMDLQCIRV